MSNVAETREIPKYAVRNRNICKIILMIAFGNFLFHAFGFAVFDVTSWPFYQKLPVYAFAEALNLNPKYTDKNAAFVEFVLVIYAFMIVATLLFMFLLLRRVASWLGLVDSERIENIKYTLGVAFFYFCCLSPYFPLWFTDTHSDKVLNFPLSVQMFWQAMVWTIVVLALMLWVLSPWATHRNRR
ncbi:hypothetical protein [Roseovarius sp. EL26]|uniref:hypothetical protein n=1 Tax=Roseovarius sp. EL26 TaxID=2126672 RepID=UPI000EA2714E|nr:hypothetical protein [Roseovarius sp. EL26]